LIRDGWLSQDWHELFRFSAYSCHTGPRSRESMLIAPSNVALTPSRDKPYTTDDIPSKPFARDPGVTGALDDSEHHFLAGLLKLATPPKKFCHVIDCQPGSCLGKVEINAAGILTFVTSSECQDDKDHQLRIQLAIAKGLPDDSAALHQNHEFGLRQPGGLAPAPENERDLLRYHPHGLPRAITGQRMPHYHVVLRNGLNMLVVSNILRTLANTAVDGKRLLTPRDAAEVLNAAQAPGHYYDAASMTIGTAPAPLFPPSLTEFQLAQIKNVLQAKFIALCQYDHDRAAQNASLPAGFRHFDPVGSPPGKTTRRATNATCVQHGHTHEAEAIRLARNRKTLESLYRGPDGVRKVCNLYQFLKNISKREKYAENSVREMVTTGIENINSVLGRVDFVPESRPAPRVRSRL
jgi:hypothetical protein